MVRLSTGTIHLIVSSSASKFASKQSQLARTGHPAAPGNTR